MEASLFAGWLQQPWHILYSALRCMSCQEWQQQHVCPICCNAVRNSGWTHDAWAYFDGCITHLTTAPKCIGSFLIEDSLAGRGKIDDSISCIVAGRALSQERSKRVVANADYHLHGTRRSQTMAYVNHSSPRALVLDSVADAIIGSVLLPSSRAGRTPSGSLGTVVDQRLQWLHQLHSSSLILGPKWDATEIGEHIPARNDTDNIFHPRFIGEWNSTSANTFHAVIHERAAEVDSG